MLLLILAAHKIAVHVEERSLQAQRFDEIARPGVVQGLGEDEKHAAECDAETDADWEQEDGGEGVLCDWEERAVLVQGEESSVYFQEK